MQERETEKYAQEERQRITRMLVLANVIAFCGIVFFARKSIVSTFEGIVNYVWLFTDDAIAKFERDPEALEIVLKRYPNSKIGAHLVWRVASRKNWYSSYEEYLQKFPSGSHAKEARKRLAWLQSREAKIDVQYPGEVYPTAYQSPWTVQTMFRETGGEVAYTLQGTGVLRDNRGHRWGMETMFPGRLAEEPFLVQPFGLGEIRVPPGGKFSHERTFYFHKRWCGGRAEFLWVGEDASGHKINIYEEVNLRC
jgi:hypothetical protein